MSSQNIYININIMAMLFLILIMMPLQVMSRSRVLEITSYERHEKWMAQFGKSYKNAEEKEKRFQIFKNNVEFINSFNAAGDKPFNLSINHFADLTNDEFKASLNGNKNLNIINVTETSSSFRYHNVTTVPATMDWRKRGAVTPIKNQGSCGSCWAFATVATIEGIHQITTGELVSLSEQELVDCVKGKSDGCNGGYVDDAFDFIVNKGGITSEANYPYKKAEKRCKVKKEGNHVAKIKGFERVPTKSEKELLKAVANQPVSVYINGGGHAFQFYKEGIFTEKCRTHTDHAVTVVGYGETEDGTKYWIAKNSWGVNWGENGYIRMKRDIPSKKGLCGIATYPTYPVVA